jgi:hypothetical protein
MRPYKSKSKIEYLKQKDAASSPSLFHTFPKESQAKVNFIKPTGGKRNLNTFWIALFSILGFVIAAQLIVSNALASRGQELSKLEKQAAELSRQNTDLYSELSSQTSLNNIAKAADQLGLVQASSIEYVTINQGYSASAQ